MTVHNPLHGLGSKSVIAIYPITHLRLEKQANGMNFLYIFTSLNAKCCRFEVVFPKN